MVVPVRTVLEGGDNRLGSFGLEGWKIVKKPKEEDEQMQR